jgi:hypothetical protein
MNLYTIELECISTNEVEQSVVYLHNRDYNKMKKRIHEVVYVDNNKKEWALRNITKK